MFEAESMKKEAAEMCEAKARNSSMCSSPRSKVLSVSWLIVWLCCSAVLPAQNLVNVRVSGGNPGTPTGAAVVGTPGDTWNYFANMGGRASGGGVVTNATTIRDSSGATLPGVALTMSLSGGDGLDNYTDTGSYSPTPVLIMGNYSYENNGANYFTFTFSGLPANKAYLLYGMGNGNASGQGSTWWVDNANGHATASAAANFSTGSRNVALASNEGISWIKVPATTTPAGALTFRVVRLNAAENGSGGSGRAYLNGFQLQPIVAPVTTGLTNQTVTAGATALLSPVTTGTPTPTYQWRANGANIVGATNASLSLPNVQYSQNGFSYSLVASNVGGAVTNSMALTVLVPPAIAGLTNQAAPVGANVTLAATVSGIPAAVLQWRKNGTNISGATASSLFIVNAQADDSGTYSLVASNTAGLATNSMTLTISATDVLPNINGPADQTVIQGSNAFFTASVSGLPMPTLQWRVNDAAIPGATSAELAVSNVQYAQNGYRYALVASNTAGLATNSATLTVLVPVTILQQPTNVSVLVNSPATFSVSASGVPAVKYQWRRNGIPIANATNATYNLAGAQGADNGAMFTVTVSNSVSVVTSSNAALTVLSTMSGTFLPTNNAAGISPDQQLRLVFSSPPRLGAGKLYVRDAANNSLFATIDTSQFQTFSMWSATISNAAVRTVQGSTYWYMPIAIYGNEAWITLPATNRFAYNKTYYVNTDAGLFRDAANAAFPAITGTNAWRFATKASAPASPTASTGLTNLTVGLDGAGDFATLQGASDWVPQNNSLKRTITILPGIYREYAVFKQSRNHVAIIGSGAGREAVQIIYPYPANAPANDSSAGTLRLESSDISVRNLTFDNLVYLTNNGVTWAGPINTVYTSGHRLIFDHVLMKGGQDTLYANSGVGYYFGCEIWGSTDFIYGGALAVFDQCDIVEIKSNGGPITAPSTSYLAPHGLVFLNCRFPRALLAKGYPYDVSTSSTTFMRPWRQDGATAIINCQLDSQITTKGWAEWSATEGSKEVTCRARETGSTLIGGGAAPAVAQRQAAGAYWLNTYDPDYSPAAGDLPSNPDLAPATGTGNRLPVTINPADYTVGAIFGHSYYNLNGWLPVTLPTITAQPTNQTVSPGLPASFSVAAIGQPNPTFQWRKNGASLAGATNATFAIASAKLADNAAYSVVVSNSAGVMVSSNAVLTVPATAAAITPGLASGTLNLSWPANQTGFRLLAQTNPPGAGLTTNWQPVANSAMTNQISIPLSNTNGSIFFRLVYP